MGPPPGTPVVVVALCDGRIIGIFKAAPPSAPTVSLPGAVGTLPNEVCGPTAISPRPNGGGGGGAELAGRVSLLGGWSASVGCCCCCGCCDVVKVMRRS